MLGSSAGAGRGLRISICQTPSPTAGKKHKNAAHKWARGSNLLRSTIHPFVRRQILELIFGQDEDARGHGVMTETTKFITRHFVISRAREACQYIADVARHHHGVGVGALYEETVCHVGAGQPKTNGCSSWYYGALRNEHVLFGDNADGDRAIRLDGGAEVAFDEFALEVQGSRVDGFHIAQGMQHLRDTGEHDNCQHHAEHARRAKEPAALRLVDDSFRYESGCIFVIQLVSQWIPCSGTARNKKTTSPQRAARPQMQQ